MQIFRVLTLLATAQGLQLSELIPRPLAETELRTGRTVIPTLARRWDSQQTMLERRAEMMAAGLYPGVDYKICEAYESESRGVLCVRPAYALVKKLERDDWPVTVPVDLAPQWFAPPAYNTMVAGFAVGIAAAWLALGAILASGLTLSVIPSDSMTPTVLRRDVLLVDKVSPRLGWRPAPGDLVLFRPPANLRTLVATREAAAGGSSMDPNALFIKRVALALHVVPLCGVPL